MSAVLLAAGAWSNVAWARVHLGPKAPPETPPADAGPPPLPDWGAAARVGYFGGALFGEGIETYRRVNDWEIGLMGAYGSADLTSSLKDLVDGQLDGDAALAGYQVSGIAGTSVLAALFGRYFVEDTFTLTGGIGYRQIDGRLTLNAADGSGTMTADAATASVVVIASFGNSWSWPNGLTLGVDWLGVTLPVAVSSSATTTATGSVPGAARTELQSEAKSLGATLGRAPGLILVLGSVGYRF